MLRPNVTPVQRTQLHKPAVTPEAVRDGLRATGVAPTEFVDAWPRRTADGGLIWACCVSSIGPKCRHRS